MLAHFHWLPIYVTINGKQHVLHAPTRLHFIVDEEKNRETIKLYMYRSVVAVFLRISILILLFKNQHFNDLFHLLIFCEFYAIDDSQSGNSGLYFFLLGQKWYHHSTTSWFLFGLELSFYVQIWKNNSTILLFWNAVKALWFVQVQVWLDVTQCTWNPFKEAYKYIQCIFLTVSDEWHFTHFISNTFHL